MSCERCQLPAVHEQPSAHRGQATALTCACAMSRSDIPGAGAIGKHPELGRRRPLCSSIPLDLHWRCMGED